MDPALNISQNLSFGSDPNKLPDMDLRGTSSFPDIRTIYVESELTFVYSGWFRNDFGESD